MLLESVTLKGRKVCLAKQNKVTKGSNAVTVIMGNNGCGKSNLFQNICFSFIKSKHKTDFYYDLNNFSNVPREDEFEELNFINNNDSFLISKQKQPFFQRYQILPSEYIYSVTSFYPFETVKIIYESGENEKNELISDLHLRELKEHSQKAIFKKNSQFIDSEGLELPSKVLAVTGSPYDKFPFLERRSSLKLPLHYVYLGTRSGDLTGSRFRKSYLSKKFDQLGASFIKLLLKPKHEYFDFSQVFEYLKIDNAFTLNLTLSERFRIEEVDKNKILEMVKSIKFFKDKDHFELQLEKKNQNLAEQLVEALEYVLSGKVLQNHFFEPVEISCDIDLSNKPKDKKFLSALELLSEYDLIELSDVQFKKRNSNEEFLLSEASSGELSLLFTMSSIAGEIENNSLILIDEPELSLHPGWQLGFLDLLQNTFSNYKDCHFIIATHSPNLISSISKHNSFIVNLGLTEPRLMLSEDYHNRSSDFQLAKVFESPGNSNEYLIKLAINIFAKVKVNKAFDEQDFQNLEFMNSIRESLPEKDSVIELIEMLNEVYQKYGRN